MTTERVVRLSSGHCVSRALFETVLELQATSHTITVNDGSDVVIHPPVDPDVWYGLDCQWRDTVAVLADGGGPAH
jgi:hypothetical protein